MIVDGVNLKVHARERLEERYDPGMRENILEAFRRGEGRVFRRPRGGKHGKMLFEAEIDGVVVWIVFAVNGNDNAQVITVYPPYRGDDVEVRRERYGFKHAVNGLVMPREGELPGPEFYEGEMNVRR